jgi:tRNA/rRNA methyltransferase
LAEAAPRLLAELGRGDGNGRVALLFGSEKTGLSNDELSHCNWLLTVPMHQREGARHLSMNLGQAVAVCLYELVRKAPTSRVAGSEAAATAAQFERVAALLSELLERSGYAWRHAANSEPAQVRRLVRRIGANAVDAPVWMGILRHMLRRLDRAASRYEQTEGGQAEDEQS